MNIFTQTFVFFLYQPILNALFLLYWFLPGKDLGIAIIVLTLLIRLLLYPLSKQAILSQKALAELQPKVKEIQKKYKGDKEKQAKALLDLYRKANINPLAGFLPLLVQLPILVALYRVFWHSFDKTQLKFLYSFVPKPQQGVNPLFLGVINLGQRSLVLALLAAFLQFVQTKMLTPKRSPKKKKSDFSDIFQKQMLYFFPFFTFILLLQFPSAIALYWISTSLFSIVQQYYLTKNYGRDQS